VNYGGLQRPLVAVGCVEEAWDIGNGFREEEEKGKVVFPRLHEK